MISFSAGKFEGNTNAVIGWWTFLAMPAKVPSGVVFGSKKTTAAGFPPKGLAQNAATSKKDACWDMFVDRLQGFPSIPKEEAFYTLIQATHHIVLASGDSLFLIEARTVNVA